MENKNVSILMSVAPQMFENIQAAKKTSKLNLDEFKFRDYVNTCVVLGNLPTTQVMYDGVSIDEYKVIDAISCLSHFISRVNVVTKDSLMEKDHVVNKTVMVEEATKAIKSDNVKDEDTEAAKNIYVPRILSVDDFNRVSMLLKGALRCGLTTVTRAKITLAEVKVSHVVDGLFYEGDFDFAPVELDVQIYDEYEAVERKTFMKHFNIWIVKELMSAKSTSEDK
jgi:hypothetical protein